MFDIVRELHPTWFQYPGNNPRRMDRAARIERAEKLMMRESWTHYSPSRQDRIRLQVRKGRKGVDAWREDLLQD